MHGGNPGHLSWWEHFLAPSITSWFTLWKVCLFSLCSHHWQESQEGSGVQGKTSSDGNEGHRALASPFIGRWTIAEAVNILIHWSGPWKVLFGNPVLSLEECTMHRASWREEDFNLSHNDFRWNSLLRRKLLPAEFHHPKFFTFATLRLFRLTKITKQTTKLQFQSLLGSMLLFF